MAFTLGEYQDIFLEEADEQLQELNQNLIELEKNPDDPDIINNIFRAAHSLKSSAAFVGLTDLSDLAHSMENLLQGIRDHTLRIDTEIADVIFKTFDVINEVIETIAEGEEPTHDLSPLINEIKEIGNKTSSDAPPKEDTGTAPKSAPEVPASGAEAPKTSLASNDVKMIRDAISDGQWATELTVYIEDQAAMKWVKAQLVIANLSKITTIVKTIPEESALSSDDMAPVFKVVLVSANPLEDMLSACDVDQIYRVDVRSITLSRQDDKLLFKFGSAETHDLNVDVTVTAPPAESVTKATSEETVVEETHEAPDATIIHDTVDDDDAEERAEMEALKNVAKNRDRDHRKTPVLKTVKVSVDKLDQLLNNVAELVIANSGFYRLYDEIRKTSLEKTVGNEFKNRMEQMARIAKDLQAGIMKTRMVPIGQVFGRFNRLVRDLAKEFHKDIELVTKGEETELDKKVIDVIGEPLMHLLRNAIDHGIETGEERKTLGKSEVAHVTLNAYQGGNQIFVEVSDDGRGLDPDKIKRKAIERGLTTPEAVAGMDNQEIFNFIFAPGFSTANKITDVSGRGVGMNVVRETVNELNGTVFIETEKGMGTRFVMSFPLTLAIIPAIMVKVAGEMYAIPLSDVIETVKISQSDITTIEGHEVINFRGEILSLLRLSDFVGVPSSLEDEEKIPVVEVGFSNRKIGLIVDALEGKQEIVIKSLEQNYTTVEGLAGASILGDGSIALILDISSMINKVITDNDRVSRRRSRDIKEAKTETVVPQERNDSSPEEAMSTSKKEALQRSTKVIFDDAPGTEKIQKPAPEEPSKPETRIEESSDPLLAPAEAAPNIMDNEPTASVAPPAPPKEEAPAAAPEPSVQETPVEEAATPAETTTEPANDGNVDEKVSQALDEFRSELKSNIQNALSSGDSSEHMEASLGITKDQLKTFELITNIGAANAADSLSRIINKRIDLTIPEVVVKPVESIPSFIGNEDKPHVGVILEVMGEVEGSLLFIVDDAAAVELVNVLYGINDTSIDTINEDGISALKEITNIIGSSVLNVFAEKTNLLIKPSIPTYSRDFMQSIMDSILVVQNMESDYAILMDTAFYFENDQVIGQLLLLPQADSLKKIVDNLEGSS